jgi:RNA polymerase sigma-70 factor (ECF subfamily)
VPNQGAIGQPLDRQQLFDSVFESQYDSVSRYCLRRLGRADGEDAAAEVFAVAWRRLDEVPTGDATRAWLLGVAYRVVGNHYRGRRRRARLSARLLAEGPGPSADDLGEEIRLLHVALDSLREGDRELLRMASWDGLDRREIAAVIGIKENAVDQRLFRARQRLKDRLDRLRKENPRMDPTGASA